MATKRAGPARRAARSPKAAKTTAKTTAKRATKAAATTRAPGRRERNKEATRRRIVTSALDLFEKKGVEATTTKAIARKAGVAEGTVFNYFETKEDIALHFFELEVDHAIAAVRGDARLRAAPLEERLFALVTAQIEYLAPYENFIGAAFVRALSPASKLGLGARALALRARYLAFVEELIRESLPRERDALGLSWIAPSAFWIFYLGVLLYWLHDSSPGKEATLAFVDRSLRLGVAFLRRGAL